MSSVAVCFCLAAGDLHGCWTGTRSRVADALPQGAGGFSPSISWDALKNAVAATSLKQPDTQDGAVYSTSINRRAELTQAKATTVPRIGSVTQNKV